MTGSIFKVEGRAFVDSAALLAFSERAADVQPTREGYRVALSTGAVLVRRHRARLPGQSGQLYEIVGAEGRPDVGGLVAACGCQRRLHEQWPSACAGGGCGCTSCRGGQ